MEPGTAMAMLGMSLLRISGKVNQLYHIMRMHVYNAHA